jgi:malate dehydrogenase (oxaloacetate-decarboxylating)
VTVLDLSACLGLIAVGFAAANILMGSMILGRCSYWPHERHCATMLSASGEKNFPIDGRTCTGFGGMEMAEPLQRPADQRVLEIPLSGYDLINSPRFNKGTAFSDHERDIFELHGLLPPHLGTLDEQVERRTRALAQQQTAFNKYAFLRDLQDTNETLFYALLVRNIEQMLPLVYTPTVGEGCQRFSEIWRKPRGLFLSYPNKDRIDRILSHPRYDGVKCIVFSDGERILGLGDQGAGGMGIPIGKMALYTALGGIHPEHCLPILLDLGTNNEERLKSPIYIGWSHHRIRGKSTTLSWMLL